MSVDEIFQTMRDLVSEQFAMEPAEAVSYTHLDVYKRQEFLCDSPKLLKEALLWGAEVRTVVALSLIHI